MELFKVIPSGYCKGVVNAINLAKKAALDYPDKKITMLGMIVHNRYVVEALKHYHIDFIEQPKTTRLKLLDQINEGVVIFTAHGVCDEVINKAQSKGLICINASCGDVIKTQTLIKEAIADNYNILYIGKQFHPESEAVTFIDSEKINLITSVKDVDPLPSFEKVFVSNQTTMSILEISEILEAIRKKYPHAVIHEEVCNATRIRQEAILKLENVDCLFVVGDPHSNNSNKLKDIALKHGIPHVELIENVQDINIAPLKNYNRVAVTAGASTPTYLTDQVVEWLKSYCIDPNTEKPSINIHKIL